MSEPRRNLTLHLPLVTGTDGQPYISCLAVAALLEYVATTIRITGLDGEAGAELLDSEASALTVRAIARTGPERSGQ
ncbi:hypothetical protein N4G70_29060 [Streptomyces sp. ASQP_92]|uniref:hypothetical protein n=1 Tax=Streptomyces sp. ASQP_92 TaxID=2979116 RepID=UPI0021BEDC37|nr:hypothetical protein [Streptomyces sp. ASQP_92]MCT9092891.1 hypothetical protein [Streptomyces sp. ASQP_92]